jgi:hypothetical protein
MENRRSDQEPPDGLSGAIEQNASANDALCRNEERNRFRWMGRSRVLYKVLGNDLIDLTDLTGTTPC